MTKNTTSRTSSTASNNSSSDSGKKPPIFLKDIPEEYQTKYDLRDEYSPSNIGRKVSESEWEEWKKQIERAHVFECLVAQNLQNMKPPAHKLKATQYWHATPSLGWNDFTLNQFKRRVSYHRELCTEETLEKEREELLAAELNGLINIETVVCKTLGSWSEAYRSRSRCEFKGARRSFVGSTRCRWPDT